MTKRWVMHIYAGGRHVLEFSGYHAQALCGVWRNVVELTADPGESTCAACDELDRENGRRALEISPDEMDIGDLLQAGPVPRQTG